MKIPVSVDFNTYQTYKLQDSLETGRKLKAEDFLWESKSPKLLATLCIEKISKNWAGSPKLEELIPKDREILLRILPTNISLEVLVKNINSDVFWKRYYNTKWRDSPIIADEKKWINVFLEHFYAEVLESINPRDYDPEKISTLVQLCGPFIQSLELRSLIPSDLSEQRNVSPDMIEFVTSQKDKKKIQNPGPVNRDHISLHAAIGSLNNLTDLHITYQLKNAGIEYRRDQFQFTENDAIHLARGLEKCPQLKTFRLTRSDMNCHKLKYLLRGLSENFNLETIDFSHCKISNDGASNIAKFISRHENIRNLIIADNIIGPSGAEYISYTLNNIGCGLRTLDLRLNDRLGSEGISHIAVSIARGCNLTCLNISSCGIKPGPLQKPPAGVWSALSAENPPTCGDLLARAIGLVKTPLRCLDISVNDIGSPSDSALANAICLSYINEVNLKGSGMGSMAMAIAESAAAAQRLRREADKGIKFRRSAARVLQARRVVRGMNIEADPVLFAQQLSARPSIVSVTSEEGTYNIQTQPLPSVFGFVPALRSPLRSSQESSITGPSSSRRSSHHVLEPVQEIRRSALIRRGSDGSLLQAKHNIRHIKIFVSRERQT